MVFWGFFLRGVWCLASRDTCVCGNVGLAFTKGNSFACSAKNGVIGGGTKAERKRKKRELDGAWIQGDAGMASKAVLRLIRTGSLHVLAS